jgi:hypothetical protein
MMNPEFALIVAAFLVVLVVLAIAARLLVPVIAQHFKGAAGGWSRLSEVYATTRHLPTQLLRRQTLMVGQVLYRKCVTMGSDDTGLYLELGFPISILGKRPLFLPWTEFKRVEEGRLFWRKADVLSLGAPLVGTITVLMELFNSAIRPRISKAATDLDGDTP